MTALAGSRPQAPAEVSAPAATGLPRDITILLHACAALIWVGVLTFYVRVWLAPKDGTGDIERSVRDVVDGTAGAPFQYRILVPHVIAWLHDTMGWPYGYAELVVDIAMLMIAVWAVHLVLRKLDLERWLIPVALFGAYVQVGTLWWGKVETITAFAGVSIAVWALLCDDRRRWVPLAVAAFILAGTRTDLLLAVSAAFAARWFFGGRDRRDVAAAAWTGIAGLATTIALKAAYPDATYDTAARMFQLRHNLTPLVVLTAAAFILPALGPFLLVRTQPAIRRELAENRRTLVPLLVLAGAEIASILVVGRADEIRLLFPISVVLAIVAVHGWRALLGAMAPDGNAPA